MITWEDDAGAAAQRLAGRLERNPLPAVMLYEAQGDYNQLGADLVALLDGFRGVSADRERLRRQIAALETRVAQYRAREDSASEALAQIARDADAVEPARAGDAGRA